MDLIILAWRVLPVQLGLCPPLPNDVPLALNKILFSNHIYLLSVFQTCLTHFLNLTCCPPHLEVCLSRPDSFQKAFYLNFPAYMTSLCTHGSHFALNIYWPVTALTLWNYFVIDVFWSVQIISPDVTVTCLYTEALPSCVCPCVPWAKCDHRHPLNTYLLAKESQ